MDFQFYPTPTALASRAWSKFKRPLVRVLEPSAGEGHLAEACPGRDDEYHRRRAVPIDCCEIDITKHGTLRAKGINVVGVDFLQFGSGAIYSSIILNPPFADGVKHVLKAWDILWDGEVVAIINAESVRNPFSAERRQLVQLIEKHGEVEFIDGAFMVEDAERKTEVAVALVYLRKEADVNNEIFGDLFAEIQKDQETGAGLAGEFADLHAVALPNSFIENSVLAFTAAVRSMRDSVISEARARHYAALLGNTMARRNGDCGNDDEEHTVEWVRAQITERYNILKDRAWSAILRSSNVTSRLSSAAQRRLEAEFEQIKRLEFTVSSIYSFLQGLIDSQGKIAIDMALDVFDSITKYHTENTAFYCGWKSNDKHRTGGIRIKTTRFILPHHSVEKWHTDLPWDSRQLLADFDKVFAMLDGKRAPDFGLVETFRVHFEDLKNGKRCSSSYFDVRFYPGKGTIHFFARDKGLVDRLNRLVGRQRAWLPPEGVRVSDAFWLQFDEAEKMDGEVRKAIHDAAGHRYWDNPLNRMFSNDKEEHAKAMGAIANAVQSVLTAKGINTDFLLEDGAGKQEQALLPLAA